MNNLKPKARLQGNAVETSWTQMIVEIAGARPNFMKIAPLHLALTKLGRPVSLINTGQHFDPEMSDVFFRDLALPEPDFHLGVGSGSHATQTAQVMHRLEPLIEELQPALTVVVGDVNSTLAGALTAAKMRIPVAHVEAGLRSGDRTMPEEINRIVTDQLSQLLFAPSDDAVDNLRFEGLEGEKIHMVGNVMIDTLDRLLPKAQESEVLAALGVSDREYFLATIHRPSNVDGEERLREVVSLLQEVGSVLPVVLPAHPRTQKRLDQMGFAGSRSLHVTRPLGYVDFLRLMGGAAAVLTDSGGVQEETTVLGVPCLTLRDNTERPITVTHGTNKVVGLDGNLIMSEIEKAAAGERHDSKRPPLWDGNAAERIAALIEQFLS